MANVADRTRWEQEAEFFDDIAATRTPEQAGPIDPAVVARYRSPGRIHPKEYCCRIVGDLHGKKVLDVGCGEGQNTLLLAKLGARVTGIDISPKAIELARKRAALSGVADSTEFICGPVEAATLPAGHFDVIWADNVLHHVLPVLDQTMAALMKAAKPGAQVVFFEPTNLNETLRRIRFLVPVHTETTPGERPLEAGDLEIIRRHLPQFGKRHFTFLTRLNRFVIPDFRYERASPIRRFITDALAAIDALVLSFPVLETLGGASVIYGHAPLAQRFHG